MAETYCGKSCADCAQKEALACPGCRMGPGRHYDGDCELAKCVRSKGHDTCDTCIFRGNCGILRGRENMPDYWRKKANVEQERKAEIARRAPVLGKWLWVLFWMVIPCTAASLLTNENIVGSGSVLYLPGQIFNILVSVAYGLCLIKLSSEDDRYRTAGICSIAASCVNVFLALTAGGKVHTWTLMFYIPAAIVAFIGEYNEYQAHSAILEGTDRELSEKWSRLWKWYAGLLCGMLGSLLVMLMIPLLGILVMLAAAIGIVVVGVMKMVYLYRSASIFRAHAAQV